VVLDRNMVPRGDLLVHTQTFIIWYRKDEKSPEELTRYDRAKGPTFVPLLRADNQTLQVAFTRGATRWPFTA
jgi:hypothetical protein